MRNSVETSVRMKRTDICDLLLACDAAKVLSNDGGEKWDKLHDLLISQLDELDRQLDENKEVDNDN